MPFEKQNLKKCFKAKYKDVKVLKKYLKGISTKVALVTYGVKASFLPSFTSTTAKVFTVQV